ncbi:glycine-rich protein [Raphanus sativus]|uniref:Uncharacterized protein LOC130494939 n=1 Tax=Raphanus sativus TaxID=3726 RepID=A0A9W3BR14_RAPSA|nr:uncharacterized protein LOC130494939 [Raphanus sativus]KAJ4895400.1 glycine-rich protein [Raphanus sativus]
MGLKRTSLVLYILFIFHLHHAFPSTNALPSSVDTNHTPLPLINDSKPDVISFQGNARELAVVIKRGAGGGGGRGTVGGRSRSSGVGRVVPIHSAGAGAGRSHSSSGSLKLAVGWLGLSFLAGLLLV